MTDTELKRIVLQKIYDRRKEWEKDIHPSDFTFAIGEYELYRILVLLHQEQLIMANIMKDASGTVRLVSSQEITSKGIDEIENPKTNSKKEGIADMKKESTLKIFISHAHEDAEILKNFIKLLQGTIDGLKDSDIRCSSVKGHKFKSGEDFLEMIKKETSYCEVIISAFSEAALKSSMVMFECGIGWYLGKVVPIILSDEIDYEDLPKPFGATIAKKIFDEEEVIELIEEIAEKLGVETKKMGKVNEAVREFLDKL